MKKLVIVIGLLIFLVLSSGCAQFGTYMKDRGNDFIDCFKGQLSVGMGIEANIRVTEELQAGLGMAIMFAKAGIVGRNVVDGNDKRGGFLFEAGLAPLYYQIDGASGPGHWNELYPGRKIALGIPYGKKLYVSHGDHDDWHKMSIADYEKDVDKRFFEIGFSFHALLLGIDFGFDLREFADFLLGWFSVDITEDDTNSMWESIDK